MCQNISAFHFSFRLMLAATTFRPHVEYQVVGATIWFKLQPPAQAIVDCHLWVLVGLGGGGATTDHQPERKSWKLKVPRPDITLLSLSYLARTSDVSGEAGVRWTRSVCSKSTLPSPGRFYQNQKWNVIPGIPLSVASPRVDLTQSLVLKRFCGPNLANLTLFVSFFCWGFDSDRWHVVTGVIVFWKSVKTVF